MDDVSDFDKWMAAEGDNKLAQALTHPSLAAPQVRVLLESCWLKGMREGIDLGKMAMERITADLKKG
jgi:hypothetical protein